ncbi:MAG TPA: 2'-5' RNA ligase family protein [Chloroflexota bacterium]|nr:2'-5' RNA ligase family protein [Chloroflexota bacterium]
MPFAIEFSLDDVTSAIVQKTWQKLAEAGLSTYMHTSGARPHVTLDVADQIGISACEQFLKAFAAVTPSLPVTFSSFGIFPADPVVVFLAPVVTSDLLALHDTYSMRFRAHATNPWKNYLREHWVPHCTLAMDIPPGTIPRIVEVCQQLTLPITGRFTEVGLVEFRPVNWRCAFELTGTSTDNSVG